MINLPVANVPIRLRITNPYRSGAVHQHGETTRKTTTVERVLLVGILIAFIAGVVVSIIAAGALVAGAAIANALFWVGGGLLAAGVALLAVLAAVAKAIDMAG